MAEPAPIRLAASVSKAPGGSGVQSRSGDAAAPLRRLLHHPRPLVWVFTGDSVSLGGDTATVTYAECFQRHLTANCARRSDVVIGTAIASQTAQELLHDFLARSGRFRPDVVSMMLGLSDVRRMPVSRSEFRDTLEQLIVRIRDDAAQPLLQTPPYCGDEWLRRQLEPLIDVMLDVTHAYHLPCVDHWNHWRVAAADAQTLTRWLAPDRIHASRAGHQVMTALLLSTLGLARRSSTSQKSDSSERSRGDAMRSAASDYEESAVSTPFRRITRAT